LSQEFRFKDKRSKNQARKLVLTMARYGDHGHQLRCDLSNEEGVKEFYRLNGYNFEVEVEKARKWSPGLPMMVPIFDVRTMNSFTLGGAPGSIGGIKAGGEDFLVKFEGESGHVVMSEYLDIFENAAAELERSVGGNRHRPLFSGNSHRAFLTAISDGIASIEGYITYQADRRGGKKFKDSKQEKVSFEDKINEWIPQITGRKLDKGGVNWNHHKELRGIRDNFQAHPKTHLYGITYSEICRRMNLFRTGIAGLLFDLHLAFNDLVPAQIIHGYFLPEIQYVIEPEYSQPKSNQS
jgi:hypothetical protein